MRCCLLSFTLFFCVSAVAQQSLDTLKGSYSQALTDRNYKVAGILKSEIAKHFANQPNYDSALYHYLAALKINESIRNDSMIASNFNDIGAIYKSIGNLDSAITYYSRSINEFKRIRDTLRFSFASINLAMIYNDRDNNDKALELAFNAIVNLERRPLDYTLGTCYMTIGTSYYNNKDYNKALSYFFKSLNVARTIKYPRGTANSLNNIGNVYLDTKQYDSALSNFTRALEIKRTLSNKKSSASTLNNIGDVLFEQKKLGEAKVYYAEALKLKQETGDRIGEIITLNNLAECELLEKKFELAAKYLYQAASIEKTVRALGHKAEILRLKIILYRGLKNYQKASDYAEELILINDSLYSKDKAIAMERMQANYENDKKEQQIIILNNKNELNATTIKAREFWIAALSGAILLVVIIALLIYNSFKISRRNEIRIETLMKELHHRVKNNLQVLSSVLSLQSQYLTDESALISVKSTESRINAMALIHRKLYSDDKNTIVSTRGYFRELIEFLMSSFGYNERNLELNADIDEIELDVDKAIPLGLIVNELISNVFKHAYSDYSNPRLDILVKQHGPELKIIIRDNGKGSVEHSGEEAKFGMRMVNILVRDLKGKFQTHINNGTEHSVIIPLA